MEKQIRKEWKKKKGSILSLARDKKTMKIQDIRQSWWCRKWDPPHGLRQRGERCRTVYGEYLQKLGKAVFSSL